MTLVERAVEELKENRVARRQRRTTQTDSVAVEPTPADRQFTLDYRALREQGLFTPVEKPERLPQELRAIKRRLLRRLKYYKQGPLGKNQKQIRASGNTRHKVLVTSTSPAEGKTFTATNLALSLALEDKVNTLLVDADIPRPRVLKYLNLPPCPGLTDRIVSPELSALDLVMTEAAGTLSLLSSGAETDRQGDVFSDPEMAAALGEVSRAYKDHLVIVDAPPVLAAPEAALLAQHVDEVVFVIKANTTPEPAAVAALEEIMEYNENISVILNQSLVPGKFSHYGSYGEYYYKSGGADE